MKRNIKLLKVILPLFQTWFWLGIWIVYYLRFTDYAGIALIEMTWTGLSVLLEIPTGAFSDLFGKKRTLFIAFLLAGIGNIFMGIAQSTTYLVISVLIMGIGGSLYSGTQDAIVFDSLKVINRTNQYEKTLAVIKRNSLLFMAFASLLGGFLYTLNVSLPFFATASAYFVGMFCVLFLSEPAIDTKQFSLKSYLQQTREGFAQLFSKKINQLFLSQLIIIFILITLLIEVVDPALALDFGFKEKQLGILYAIIPMISALGAGLYPKVRNRFSQTAIFWSITIIALLSAISSPVLGLLSGGSILLVRNFIYPYFDLISSDTINQNIESSYRATTISTFVTFLRLPYVLSIYIVGRAIDLQGASVTTAQIALIILCILAANKIYSLLKK